MKTVAHTDEQWLTVRKENVIRMPLGLLGFEEIKQYVLLSSPEDDPFLWLQMLDDPNHSFLVISPFVLEADYSPELSDDDVSFLGLESPDDALIINIVTLHGGAGTTVNLKGPIVLNRHTMVAKQVIPMNAAQFSLRHPVPLSA